MIPHNLVDQRVFQFILHREIHTATRLQYCLSLLCLTPDRPRRAAAPASLSRLAALLVSQLRATDLAARLDSSGVALLLVDAETRTLPKILERLKGGLEGIVTLSGGGGCYPQTATTGPELLQQALALMTRAHAEGGNRLHLPP